MCVFLSMRADKSNLQKRFDATLVEEEFFGPKYVQSAFEFPGWPVISSEKPDKIGLMQWGLIPHWVKDSAAAAEIRSRTVNARSETLLEKPAFRLAAAKNHCLVLADGFFEYREMNGRKFPYYIRIHEGRLFAMAGLYDIWADRSTGEVVTSFSIITTEANSLMEMVHNVRKRMPVILAEEDERVWLSKMEDFQTLLKPFPAEQMEAWPVSRLLTSRNQKKNSPEVLVKFDYPELPDPDGQQGRLF
ncbi:MAG: hypothetical protein A2X22_13450 [Bacteroidetes bacterium GWF2_49_14]|nr:MAG: hypothetical protein A2X22_13450 [Bacteroidetes bacterium GWF2_49_14]HBB93342.1 SOS response-associated peptidase [Bacteroidales bacterium]